MQTLETHPLTSNAMSALSADNALLASVLRQKDLEIEGTDIEVIGVRENTLCINAEAFGLHADEERVYMLAFMALMILFRHSERRGERDPLLWNLACGMSIHLALEDLGMTGRPSSVDGLVDGTCRNMCAEDIYEKALKERTIDLNETISGILAGLDQQDVLPEEEAS